MINEQIRCKEVRVIGEEGQQLGVMALRDALNMAKDAGVDLVMVSDVYKRQLQYMKEPFPFQKH